MPTPTIEEGRAPQERATARSFAFFIAVCALAVASTWVISRQTT